MISDKDKYKINPKKEVKQTLEEIGVSELQLHPKLFYHEPTFYEELSGDRIDIPIIVGQITKTTFGHKYEKDYAIYLIAGKRRLDYATNVLKLNKIPCIRRDCESIAEAMEINYRENNERTPLSWWLKGYFFKQYLGETKLYQTNVAKRFNVSQSYISQLLLIVENMEQYPGFKKAIQEGFLTVNEAYEQIQKNMIMKEVPKGWSKQFVKGEEVTPDTDPLKYGEGLTWKDHVKKHKEYYKEHTKELPSKLRPHLIQYLKILLPEPSPSPPVITSTVSTVTKKEPTKIVAPQQTGQPAQTLIMSKEKTLTQEIINKQQQEKMLQSLQSILSTLLPHDVYQGIFRLMKDRGVTFDTLVTQAVTGWVLNKCSELDAMKQLPD